MQRIRKEESNRFKKIIDIATLLTAIAAIWGIYISERALKISQEATEVSKNATAISKEALYDQRKKDSIQRIDDSVKSKMDSFRFIAQIKRDSERFERQIGQLMQTLETQQIQTQALLNSNKLIEEQFNVSISPDFEITTNGAKDIFFLPTLMSSDCFFRTYTLVRNDIKSEQVEQLFIKNQYNELELNKNANLQNEDIFLTIKNNSYGVATKININFRFDTTQLLKMLNVMKPTGSLTYTQFNIKPRQGSCWLMPIDKYMLYHESQIQIPFTDVDRIQLGYNIKLPNFYFTCFCWILYNRMNEELFPTLDIKISFNDKRNKRQEQNFQLKFNVNNNSQFNIDRTFPRIYGYNVSLLYI